MYTPCVNYFSDNIIDISSEKIDIINEKQSIVSFIVHTLMYLITYLRINYHYLSVLPLGVKTQVSGLRYLVVEQGKFSPGVPWLIYSPFISCSRTI